MIELTDVCKAYPSGESVQTVLDHISLQIPLGQKVAIVGKSGSGKSTLLNILTGIDAADQGQVQVDGQALHLFTEAQLAAWRRSSIGVVFQSYHLFETLSAGENVRFPMELAGNMSRKEQKARAVSLLELVGLGPMAHKFPHQLSGGEKQRVAIARALANDPIILAADEPTGNLDSQTTAQIKEIFDQLHQQGKTILMVTHERIEPREFDQILSLSDGRITPNL
ncbi:MAG: ABC transporter ATP-binding protein [Bacteroidota bacterium]